MPSSLRTCLVPAIGVVCVVTLAGCLNGSIVADDPSSQPQEPTPTEGTQTRTPLVKCLDPNEASQTPARTPSTTTATPAEVGTRTVRHSPTTTTPSPPEATGTGTPGARFYVAVTEVTGTDERRDLCTADPEERVPFDQLSAAKQQEFVTALEEGRTRADAWTTGRWYVQYNRSWYEVTIIIEQ